MSAFDIANFTQEQIRVIFYIGFGFIVILLTFAFLGILSTIFTIIGDFIATMIDRLKEEIKQDVLHDIKVERMIEEREKKKDENI